MRRVLGNVVISTAMVIFYICIPMTIVLLGIQIEERARSVAVTGTIPARFPVLVVTLDSAGRAVGARILYQWALQDYLRTLPHWSFTVPEGQEDVLNRQLESQIREIWASEHSPYGAGGFQVRRLANGRQQFTVDGSWDDDRANRGWYVADSKHFYPKRYVWYFGPGICLMYLFFGVVIGAVALGIDQCARAILKKRGAKLVDSGPLRTAAVVSSTICITAFAVFGTAFVFSWTLPDIPRYALLATLALSAVVSEMASFRVVSF